MFFGIGVRAFATESGSSIVRNRFDVTWIGLEATRKPFVCAQRPAHQVGPHYVVRRLAGVRYQLDFELPKAGVVGPGVSPARGPRLRITL